MKTLDIELEYFKCGDCGKKHGRPKGPGRKPSRCPECTKKYDRKYNSDWSRKHRSRPLYKSFVCEDCNREFDYISERIRRVCDDCKILRYNYRQRVCNARSKKKALIAIVNISKKLSDKGPHIYELKINSKVIARFIHNREESLSVILKKAADAAEKSEKEEE